jgi:hypothetical protein
MLNAEKYKKEIEKLDYSIGVQKGKPVFCPRCDSCDFNVNRFRCAVERTKWLLSEYVEPVVDWSKVAVDTNFLVSNDGEEWGNAHFAKYENGKIYAWDGSRTSWTTSVCECWNYAKLAEEE